MSRQITSIPDSRLSRICLREQFPLSGRVDEVSHEAGTLRYQEERSPFSKLWQICAEISAGKAIIRRIRLLISIFNFKLCTSVNLIVIHYKLFQS
jgi:hypothetical protein